MRTRPLRAFTIVELLVVIGCIGAMALLLLPAVQSSRGAAYQTQCRNHLRNQAVALIATHDARGAFPPGDDAIERRHHAWSARILPHLEQDQLARNLQFHQRWNDPAVNAIVASQVVDVFRCPASVLEFDGDTDYAGVQGSLLAPGTRWSEGNRSGVLVRVDRRHPGLVREKDIRDGTSRTLVIAESADREAEEHGMWADGLGIVLQSNGGVNQQKGEIASPHTGGANAAYADTHVGFLGESIDAIVLAGLCTKAGGEELGDTASHD